MASTRSEIDESDEHLIERPRGVDRQPFEDWLVPESDSELASMLGDASRAGRAVTPVGGGTKLSLGNLPSRVEIALSTNRLDRVLNYEPTDLTLSVEAGIRFGEL